MGMKKILIVDDMTVDLTMTENMLCGQYITFCASSAEEAEALYRSEHPDMVLSNLEMPGMRGPEWQKELQKGSSETVPFMFMLEDRDEYNENAETEDGTRFFIRKPFRPDVLLRRVGNILQAADQVDGLKRFAGVDSLTGLLNKASAEDELKKVCFQSNGALLMISLDGFSSINEVYGQSMGDTMLMSFADVLRASVRPGDVLGHIGGDKFIAFCKGMLEEPVVAKKTGDINEQLSASAQELMGDDMSVSVGASVGCVFVPAGGTEFFALAGKAGKALYEARQKGQSGLSIFTEEKEPDEIEESSTLTAVEKILGEEETGDGALVLSFEEFRAIYRFLQRTTGKLTKATAILRFSLPKGMTPEVEGAFMALLRKTLRSSDVVTKNGGEFLVLLVNTDFPNLSHAVERLRHAWTRKEESDGADFEYEWSVLEP